MNLKRRFDIQFFGGGGSSTQKIQKRDPEPENLTNLRDSLYNAISPSIQLYDPSQWQKAQEISNNALEQQKNLLGGLSGSIGKSRDILDEMMNVVRTGAVPTALTDAANASVMKGLNGSMGSMLNSLGNRGVVNSSITSKGINNLSQNAADAMNANYLNAYNSVINGYAHGLGGAQNNTASLINGANAAGNIPSQAYEGVSAGLMPAFNFWKAWQNSYDNREDYDTVVKQGK